MLCQFGFDSPPINPQEIAEELGVDVFFVAMPEGCENVSGFFDPEGNSIYVNKNERPKRQTFTIAHELGHKILHEDWAKSNDYKVLLRNTSIVEKDAYEQEANAFAANLLVPKKMLERYKDFASIDELSDLFAVSRQMIGFRTQNGY